MKNTDKIAQLLTKEDLKETIPFIKTLDKKEKKQLTPFLKKQFKYYRDSIQISKNRWGRRATETQDRILVKLAMTCFDLRTFRTHVWSFDKELMDEILTFYEPNWLNEYINSFGNNDWMPNTLSYTWVMEQTEKGRITPSNLLITRTLCNTIITYGRNWKDSTFTPGNLEKYDITLKEHIWNFFHFENNVYNVSRWVQFKDKKVKEEATWINAITDLAKKDKLPRLRLLKECLSAVNRDFNRNLINWYMDLFTALAPSTTELLDLQADLFQVSLSPQSKPINVMLKLCKQLVKEPTFNGVLFTENAPILLASETKSVVNSTLMVLDKLAKKIPEQRLSICTTVCDVFLHRTANLQTRAAKIISKYGDAKNESLLDTLSPFQDNLMSEAKSFLESFLPKESIVNEDLEVVSFGPVIIPKLSLDKAIDLPENFDDLAFLANQALVGNESWQVELLPAAILKFQHQMSETNINKLKPAFQRAYKYVFGRVGNARIGDSERLLAHFLGEYIQVIEQQPSKLEVLRTMLKDYLRKEDEWKANWSNYRLRKVALSTWSNWGNTNIYEPFKAIMIYAIDLLKKGSDLPLLSTPTHAPYWIDPIVFVKRLSAYHFANVLPNQADWQLAISRIAFENLEAAVKLAKVILTGEMLEMTLFLLEDKVPQQTDFQYIQEWKIAALTKGKRDSYGLSLFFPEEISNQLLGQFTYAFKRTSRKGKDYNYRTQKYEEKIIHEKKMVVGAQKKSSLPTWWGELVNWIRPKSSVATFFLFDYIKLKSLWGLGNHEIIRYTSLTPNNPSVLLSIVTKKFLSQPQYWGQADKKAVRLISEDLLNNWRGGDEIMHLFICSTLISGDKTNRTLAAEIWLKGVIEKNIDAKLMGQIIGQMVQIEFFPLKRLLEVLQEVMFNVSTAHNQALLELLQEIILQLPMKPIRNTKGLLEIYQELLAIVATEIPRIDLSDKLEEWKSVSSLKKVVRQLMAA